uniref:VASt domain-containing protein n=1 Tax=Macrostomum lignano TaxID=282301 RepID=A0A1I8H742_9PLAT
KSAAAVAIVPCLGSGSAAVAEHAGGGGVGCVPVDSGAAGGAMPGAATNGADVTDSAAAASLAAPQAAVASANEYIGLGRWNCHLKVWFDERHILRNVNVQLTEQRYCQPRAIARQFVEDQVCGTQDEEALARRIAFAFLGHPTQNGRSATTRSCAPSSAGPSRPARSRSLSSSWTRRAAASGRAPPARPAVTTRPAAAAMAAALAALAAATTGARRPCPPRPLPPLLPPPLPPPAAAPTVAPATVAAAPGQPQNPLLSHQLDCDLLSRKLDALAKQRQEAEERQRLRDCTYERICAGPRQPNHDDVDC